VGKLAERSSTARSAGAIALAAFFATRSDSAFVSSSSASRSDFRTVSEPARRATSFTSSSVARVRQLASPK
jgi:hypothetical protein